MYKAKNGKKGKNGSENNRKLKKGAPKMAKIEKGPKATNDSKKGRKKRTGELRKRNQNRPTRMGKPKRARKLAYPRLWQSVKHTSLGGSPENEQQKDQQSKFKKDTVYDTTMIQESKTTPSESL